MRFGIASVLTLSWVLLASCGGGDGVGDEHGLPAPVLQTQSIAFDQLGPIQRDLTDGGFTDAATGGAGTGAVTYQSSDPTVATVNPTTGAVELVAAGTAQITATKAADSSFQAAITSYTLTVLKPAAVPFDASIGASDTQLTFPSWVTHLDLLRSTQLDCNVVQFSSCANSQVDALGAAPVNDTTANLTTDALYWLRRGTTIGASARVSLRKFPSRSGLQITTFQNKLWVIGGQQADIHFTNDSWSSDDGVVWTQVSDNGGFPVRVNHRVVVFNDRLWVIAGNGSGYYQSDVWRNDVWSSADGVTWRKDTDAAAFPGRFGHAAVAFNGKMWVIGGGSPNSTLSDVWSSSDGANWSLVTNTPAFGPRAGHTVTVFNGKLWLIGGSGNGVRHTDVWSSSDGATWTQVTAAAAFPPRDSHAAVAQNGRLWVIGGHTNDSPYANDVWSSADGVSWTEVSHDPPFTARVQMGAAVKDGRIWIGGGEDNPVQMLGGLVLHDRDDIWSTADGVTWKQATPYAPFSPGSPNLQVLNGKLWVVGGSEQARARNEIWSSSDGVHWTQAAVTNPFPARFNPGTAVFGNALWVVGGNSPNSMLADVWHSNDGSNWTNDASAAAFGPRGGPALLALNGRLYVVGGFDGSQYLSDVWSSADGLTWSQLTTAAAFGARSSMAACVFGGRLWIVGGTNSTGLLTDAWSSADGVSWQLESSSVPGLPYTGVSLASHDGKLWLTGGMRVAFGGASAGLVFSNDVWSSSDGRAWTKVTSAAKFSPRTGSGLAELNNQLWLVGGIDLYAPRNDVWSSSDGQNWRLMYSGSVPYP